MQSTTHLKQVTSQEKHIDSRCCRIHGRDTATTGLVMMFLNAVKDLKNQVLNLMLKAGDQTNSHLQEVLEILNTSTDLEKLKSLH